MRFPSLVTASAVAAVFISTIALAQNPAIGYPSKPVMIVIPLAPGGTIDGELRLYTDKLQASTKQPWVFDYRVGAGGSIGIAYAVRAKPDGYTILSTNPTATLIPNFYPEVNHGVVSQLIPVSELSTRSAGVVVSPAALPNVRSLADLVVYGKANPGKLNCNTGGAGTGTHVSCVALANVLGVPITAVHYKGGGPGQVDLIAGRTQVAVTTVLLGLGPAKAGKLRFIAVMGANRSKLMPDVPTTHELNYDIDYPSWLGVFAPPKTPQTIVDKINAEFVNAVRAPDTIAALEKVGSIAVGGSEAAFRKKFASELANWKKIIEDNKITIEE